MTEYLIMATLMIVTICIYLYRIKNIKRFWKNFILEMFVFWVVTHMMEGVTGMMIGLIVNMVFIVFADIILRVTGFEKKKENNKK